MLVLAQQEFGEPGRHAELIAGPMRRARLFAPLRVIYAVLKFDDGMYGNQDFAGFECHQLLDSRPVAPRNVDAYAGVEQGVHAARFQRQYAGPSTVATRTGLGSILRRQVRR